MRHRYLLALVILAALSFPRSAEAQQQPQPQEALDRLLKECEVPGASAALVLNDGRILVAVSGWADREAAKPMSPETLLLQGSVGKTYVAAVALQLVDEGKLRLDEKIAAYLGQESWFERLPNAHAITVRMLMNHTSGLVRYEFQEKFIRDLLADPEKTWKPQELIGYILDFEPPFEAGGGWEYSDTNYIVLGMIIEKITGESYFNELRRRLLEPLELAQTFPVTGRVVPGLAQGYAGARNPFGGRDQMLDEQGSMILNPQFEWTGGGIASTPTDLARWAKALYEAEAFDAALLPTMLEGVSAPMLGREATYGLGVIIRPTSLGTSYGHSGFFPGYMTEVMYFPEHKLAVAVQVNTSEAQKIRPPLARWCVRLAEAALGTPPATRSAPR